MGVETLRPSCLFGYSEDNAPCPHDSSEPQENKELSAFGLGGTGASHELCLAKSSVIFPGLIWDMTKWLLSFKLVFSQQRLTQSRCLTLPFRQAGSSNCTMALHSPIMGALLTRTFHSTLSYSQEEQVPGDPIPHSLS